MTMLLFLLVFPAYGQSVGKEMSQLYERFKNAASFDLIYPREKVYVHLDNSAYIVGDTIRYKAYVVRASSAHPSDLSKVLYVELLDAEGEQLDRQVLKINNHGAAQGCIVLKHPILAGYYEVRAYTREMLNWGDCAYFSRVVPVFYRAESSRRHKKGIDWEPVRLSVPYVSKQGRRASLPRPYAMRFQAERLLSFYPEGGHCAKGVEQCIAFKLTNGRGCPVEDTVFVFRNNGTLLTFSVPEHEGMGTFMIPKDFEGGYASLSRKGKESDMKYPLPEASSDYSLHVKMERGNLCVKVLGNDSVLTRTPLLGLGIFNKEKAIYFDTLTLNTPVEMSIPLDKLCGGVNRLELFDAKGGSIASRMFWTPLTQKDRMHLAKVKVYGNEMDKENPSRCLLKLCITDYEDKPLQGADVSISVGVDNILSTHDGGIGGYMLLASELRGYIHRPDLYFSNDDAEHRRMLDLLMMVQGWTATSWDVMTRKEPFLAFQPIEKKLVVNGVVCQIHDRKRPYPHASLYVEGWRDINEQAGVKCLSQPVSADEKGRFTLNIEGLEGNGWLRYSLKNPASESDWSRIVIDQWFSPVPKAYFEPELELHCSPHSLLYKDKRMEKIKIGKKMVGTSMFNGMSEGETDGINDANLYVLNVGNQFGMVRTLKYYDVLRLGERLKDSGIRESMSLLNAINLLESNTIFEIGLYAPQVLTERIREMNKAYMDTNGNQLGFDILQVTDKSKSGPKRKILYRGSLLKVYINDECAAEVPDLETMRYDSIRSVALVQSTEAEANSSTQRNRYSLYIYTVGDGRTGKYSDSPHEEYRYVCGYARQSLFYSPDYSQHALMQDTECRRTIYWNTDVHTDDKGEAVVEFAAPFVRHRPVMDISVRGLSAEGMLIDYN